MQKYSLSLAFVRFMGLAAFFICIGTYSTQAFALDYYDYVKMGITPIPCGSSSCPSTGVSSPQSFPDFYSSTDYTTSFGGRNDTCAPQFAPPAQPATDPYPGLSFVSNPKERHYWVEDQEITDLGKSAERARQFIYWAIKTPATDQALPLKQIWSMNRNIALSIMILVSAVLGLAIIVSNRVKSGYKFSVQGSITKIGLSILYIALSASVIFTLIALSDILMKFFIEALGGDKIFNTYFGTTSNELNYTSFYGCKDLNIRVQEAAQAEMFLVKLSNVTHYMMGSILILRRILLWFLLLISPFLPLLLSFPLIRNTGKIWIGVFFQWLFYGPLFALFFGTTAKLFTDGIPFLFDFSRIEKAIGYVYPTAIILTYGGPAQKLNGLNNGNYIDTFAEYIIALIFFWAATWFPWWLLRIFRDDCCDGIYAMKNALYGFIEKTTKPPPHPSGPPPPQPPSPKFEMPIPQSVPQDTRQKEQSHIRLENVNMVHAAKTADLASTLNLRASSLRDIARLETNKQAVSIAKTNFALLSNPLSATTAADRQKYLNLRTELFTRASTKNDTLAQYMLTATSRSSQSYINKRNEIAKSMESVVSRISEKNVVNLTESTAQATHTTFEQVTNITNSVINNVVNNQTALQSIAVGAHTTANTSKQILQSYAQQISQPIAEVINKISEVTQTSKEQVREVLRETHSLVSRAHSVERITRMVAPSKEHSTQVLTQINNFVSSIAQTTSSIGNQVVNKVSQMTLDMVRNEPTIMNEIERNTQTTTTQIYQTLQMMADKGISIIREISEKTNLTREQIQKIIVESARVVETKAPASANVITQSGASLTDIVRTTLQSEVLSSNVAKVETTTVSQLQKVFEDKSVSTFTKELLKQSTTDEHLITNIQTATSLSRKQVEEVITRLVNAPSIADTSTLERLKLEVGVEPIQAMQIVREVVKQAGAAQSVVSVREQRLDTQTAQILEKKLESVVATQTTDASVVTTSVSEMQKVFEDQNIRTFTKELLKQSITNTEYIKDVVTETNLSKEQIQKTVDILTNTTEMVNEKSIEEIKKTVGVDSRKVMQIIQTAVKRAQTSQAPLENRINNAQTAQILEQQLESALNPDTQIDQAIPLPEDAQSLEEYEEIRQLWMDQYEKGEVPLSDEIHTRLEWVEQDAFVITEILSKLVSPDETVRQQALDEVGFILPVFLMNNLSGTQLITYLKAKASAAKEVRLNLKQKLDAAEGEMEEVSRQTRPVEENIKHLEVDESGETRTVEEGENQKGETLG